MKAKARVPDPRDKQPERLAANEAGCGRISLPCASIRRKIALNSPGIQGMSVYPLARHSRRLICQDRDEVKVFINVDLG
jgi:hypothetical protein